MGLILLVRHGQASFGAADYDKLSGLGVRQSQALGEFLRDRATKPDRVLSGSLVRHRGTAEACLDTLGVPLEPEIDPRWDEFDHREIVIRHQPAYRSRAVTGLDLLRTGRPARTFQELFDAALARWVAADAGYDETWPAFTTRVREALHDLAAGLGRARTVLVFTSGGPISTVAATLLGGGGQGATTGYDTTGEAAARAEPHPAPGIADRAPGSDSDLEGGAVDPALWSKLNRVAVNTGVTRLVTGRRGVTLVSYNEHSHLGGELLSYR